MAETYPPQDSRRRQEASRAAPPRLQRGVSGRSIGTLLRDVSRELSVLLRQEGALARAELREKMAQAGSGARELGAGALIAFAGLLFLLHSATYGLRLAVGSMWLSALLVGGATLLIGLVLLARARGHLRTDHLTPERTMDSLGRDAALARDTGESIRSRSELAHDPGHDRPEVTRDPGDDRPEVR